MDQEHKQRFNLHLPGLLEVLAGSLYSSAKVGIRELLQNAHDSCIRRQVEGHETNYQPLIHVTTDAATRTLTITDNGHGLSAADIENYLSTIGRSYTGELKTELGILSPDEAAKLIGQFGFGFLSAFLLAEQVNVVTRSIQPEHGALRWHSAGGEYYEIEEAVRERPGTTVELHVKPNASFVFNERILIEAIQLFADFLPVPIYVNTNPEPVNVMTPPWLADDLNAATIAYIERKYDLPERPLCVIHLHDQTIDLGHDAVTIPLKGFLFVPAHSVASVREYGDLTVFIRRMFITDDQKELLPPWARFVRGMIDCPYLQPTASRESVHVDDTFTAVQRALEFQLGRTLQQIAQEDPVTWRKIVQGHTDVITGWAVRDNEFFKMVADLVIFRTSRGYLTLPDYLELTDNTFYYVTRHLGSLQEQLLAEGHGAPVIDAHWFAVKPFLQKYATWHEGIELVQMDGDVEQLMQQTAEQPFAHLLDFYRRRGVRRVQVVTFQPADVPGLMVYPQDAEFLMETRQAIEQDELPDPLADLVTNYLEANITPDAITGTFYLNAACPLVRQLAETDVSGSRFEAILMLIYQIARLFSGRTLTAADATLAFRDTIDALEELMGHG